MFDSLRLILQAGWVVKLVLLVLAAFSVVSWAVIVFKWRELSRALQDSEAFLDVYHEGSMDAAYEAARSLERSALAEIYVAGYSELNRMSRYGGPSSSPLEEGQVHALSRHVDWAASREALRFERGLPFLATTGSATPFIGLFGTVVGIITSFEAIGRAGTASLSVVAPGIAEALIATAAGLLTAIPATIFYNVFVGQLRTLTSAIDLFLAEFQADLRRVGSSAGQAAHATGG